MTLDDKIGRLEATLKDPPGALVAYSGGCDSTLLAEVAHLVLGSRALAAIADSPSLPRRELREAKALAAARGWRLVVVDTAELDDPRYASNPVDRCYFCKTALFDALGPIASGLGWPVMLGTVADDLGDWRPGIQAADEQGARHPLATSGFTKADVREASRRFGLPTADKPASACLASRFAYGVGVTREGLRRVEATEEELLRRGFRIVRVRDLGDDRARIEVSSAEVPVLLGQAGEVVAFCRELGFTKVEIDERGYRSGAMNEAVAVEIGKRKGHR